MAKKTKTSKTKTSRPFPPPARDVTEFPLQVRRAARVAFRKGEAASESPRGERFPSVSDARMFPSRTETEKADDASSARDAYERMLAAEHADRAAIMSASRRKEATLDARGAPRIEREQLRLAQEIALYGEERVVDSAKKAEDIAKRVDDQRSARRFARSEELLTDVWTRGLDKPPSALIVDSVLDRPFSPDDLRSIAAARAEYRTEYTKAVKARAARVKSGKMSFAEARRPVNPGDFEVRDTSQFAAARKAAAAAERPDFVFKDPEEEMYVPRGPEAYGATKSVDVFRFARRPSAATEDEMDIEASAVDAVGAAMEIAPLAAISGARAKVQGLEDDAMRTRRSTARAEGRPVRRLANEPRVTEKEFALAVFQAQQDERKLAQEDDVRLGYERSLALSERAALAESEQRALRFRKAQGRSMYLDEKGAWQVKDSPPPSGPVADEEMLYAEGQIMPSRKATAARFTTAARALPASGIAMVGAEGKERLQAVFPATDASGATQLIRITMPYAASIEDTQRAVADYALDNNLEIQGSESGSPIAEGIASRYALDPKLSGALVALGQKATKRDLNLRRLAAEAEVEFLVPQLTGARKSFSAKLSEYNGLSRKQRDRSRRASQLRYEIKEIAKEFGFALPPKF